MSINKNIILAAALAAALVGAMHFAPKAYALDISLDGVGSISAGGSSTSLNKSLGILKVIQDTWFYVLDTIAVIILIVAAFILRSRNPDKWQSYFHTLLAVGLALAAPIIIKILKELVASIT